MSGPRASDGSPVELYARLPTFGEPELVHDAIPEDAEILELGAGAGRMTHRLIELGHPITAVDGSAEMLAHVRGAQTVHSQIEELELGRRFPVVLLASHLVNVSEDRQRHRMLAACTRHVTSDGVVLLQRYDPAWAADPRPSSREVEGMTVEVVEARRDGPFLHGIVDYRTAEQSWRHGPFVSRILDDREIAARLRAAGLRLERWLDDRREWVAAVPEPDTSGLYVPFPAAEGAVGEWRLLHDAVAAGGVTAHVTVLYPFAPPGDVDEAVIARLGQVLSGFTAFDCRFAQPSRFEDRVVWLAPEPADRFRAMTDALHDAWPDFPPYGGTHEQVVPHLTVADGAPGDELERVERALTALLPISDRAERVDLVARRSGSWVRLATIPLRPSA